ncbi:hypothetical protein HY357_01455 [Candidatus Roizmanbacteria bacterium]|nr:hypothetical protein [Candidatus Roizmanbacteria bacterium]
MKKKLEPHAFGMALGTICMVLHFVLWIISLVFPRSLFSLIFNAQFFGADIAENYHLTQNIGLSLLSLIIFTISGYLIGFFFAFVYDRFVK